MRVATMPDKPTPESVERAARLREQIDRLTRPEATPAEKQPEDADRKRPMSPHEFIERRMNELDRKK
jgi:hypothetical protein